MYASPWIGLGMTMITALTTTTTTRCSAGQIRRAAGSKDPTVLPEAIMNGWTVEELDDMDGKNALHMAAWQGCLENVQLLLEMGCNPNVIATGEYSYGKTPIFFAATRSRDNVVQYLLQQQQQQQHAVSVSIVNNKGQSVLSIASSHLTNETIRLIQNAEEPSLDQWQNFRQSHSDGLEYGDLDPRFLDRPLRPTDHVTDLAINPTTKESRRGSFARKNPQHVAKQQKQKQKIKQQQQKKQLPFIPSSKDMKQLDQLWDSMRQSMAQHEYDYVVTCMIQIIQLEMRQRRSWIPTAVQTLRTMIEPYDDDDNDNTVKQNLRRSIENTIHPPPKNKHDDKKASIHCTPREAVLLEKWAFQAIMDQSSPPTTKEQTNYQEQANSTIKRKSKNKHTNNKIDLSIPPWSVAMKGVHKLSKSLIMNSHLDENYLALPNSPEWIDSEQTLDQLIHILHNHANDPDNPTVIALDTEWYTSNDDHGSIHASTLQISIIMEGNTCQTWVVDLLSSSSSSSYTQNNSRYLNKTKELLLWLFDETNVDITLLGFAFGHDLPKLSQICGTPLSSSKCLDLQQLCAQKLHLQMNSLPGLQACCTHYICHNTPFKLSKKEQCSDWALRPLLPSQLEYAGLDAAVLLVLAAEIISLSSLKNLSIETTNQNIL